MHKLVSYNGKAYCVTVDNGLILTRLNGKCVITGNSTEATSKVKEIMYERFIKSIQHKISMKIKKELINPILEENGKEPNLVTMRFNSVTDSDEAVKAKWMGNLLRGFPEGNGPFTINEIRAVFDYDPIEGGDELMEQGSGLEDNKPAPTSENGTKSPKSDEKSPKSDKNTEKTPKKEQKRSKSTENDRYRRILARIHDLEDELSDVKERGVLNEK